MQILTGSGGLIEQIYPLVSAVFICYC